MRYAPLALATLAGCGAGAGVGTPDLTETITVTHDLDPGDSAEARTFYDPTRIRVRPDQEHAQRVESLMIHELVHAATGIGLHLERGCYMDENAGNMEPGEPPCEEELGWMLDVEGTFTVRVPGATSEDRWLLDATAFAVAFWNEQVGRQMFVLDF